MQVLDTTIANVSIPTIAGNLGVSADQGTWIITSFAVANGVSVPLTGWLMRRFGVVRTFVLSILLFTLASFLCGIAWSLPVLLVFRVLQGAVSGPMIPGSQALLLSLFPAEKKGTALAIWSMTTLVAPICGPILGGYISDNYPWEWIFLINVPVGLFCAAICWRFLRTHETPTRMLPIDKVGLVLLVVWVVALQVMMDQGKDLDWFSSKLIVTLAIVSVLGLAAWIIWELTEEHPIVDLTLFKSRSFTLGTLALCLCYRGVLRQCRADAALAANSARLHRHLGGPGVRAERRDGRAGRAYRGTLHWQIRRARICRRFLRDLRHLLLHARGVAPGCERLGVRRAAARTGCGHGHVLRGAGDDIPRRPAARARAGRLRPQQLPAHRERQLCHFAHKPPIWDRREALHQSRLVESLSAYDPGYSSTLAQLHAHGFVGDSAAALVQQQVIGQGYLLSSLDIFYFSGWLVILLIPLCWLVRRPAGGGGAVASE